MKNISDDQKIGWIGLGKMGIPMSKNLLKADYVLIVNDLIEERMKQLADQGAQVADRPKALAGDFDVIISMISDDPALEAVAIGPDGAFETAKPGTIFIDMSTVSPAVSARVAGVAEIRGITYLRALVSGSTIFDSLILCRFYRDLYQWEELATMIKGTTGIDMRKESLRSIAATITNDTRRFNLREGLTLEKNRLPKRFYSEVLPETGKVITGEQMQQLLTDYYQVRGWDEKGRPPDEAG